MIQLLGALSFGGFSTNSSIVFFDPNLTTPYLVGSVTCFSVIVAFGLCWLSSSLYGMWLSMSPFSTRNGSVFSCFSASFIGPPVPSGVCSWL